MCLSRSSLTGLTCAVSLLATAAAGVVTAEDSSAKTRASTYRFDGPVVFVKDRRGHVGAVFQLNRALPKGRAGVSGTATLRNIINDRPISLLRRTCYESVLNFPPKWGKYGNRYTLHIRLSDGSSIAKSGVLYKASTSYALNEGTGLRRDPKVARRVSCSAP